MDTIDGDKLRGHLETLVLSALEQGEAHGLEILHRLETAGCGLLRLKEGSLYPASIGWRQAGRSRRSGNPNHTAGAAPGDASIS
jgi:hypothetical protein